MPPVGFEATTPAGERPQTYVSDRAANGTGIVDLVNHPIRILASTQIILAVYVMIFFIVQSPRVFSRHIFSY
jgi:hypothetical protein